MKIAGRARPRPGPTSGLTDKKMNAISDEMLNAVDEEVRRIADECYADARRLLKENRDRLDRIVEQLLIHETLDEREVYEAAGVERPATAQHPTPALP
jgi:cell division protease FtsH